MLDVWDVRCLIRRGLYVTCPVCEDRMSECPNSVATRDIQHSSVTRHLLLATLHSTQTLSRSDT